MYVAPANSFLDRIRLTTLDRARWRVLAFSFLGLAVLLCLSVWPLEVVVGIAVAVSGIDVARRYSLIWDPRRDERYRALAAYGDPERVSQQLEPVIAYRRPHALNVIVSPDWIVFPDFVAVRPHDVMWLYADVANAPHGLATRRRPGHAAVVVVRRLDPERGIQVPLRLAMRGSVDAVLDLLAALARAAPWAHVGYSQELEAAFRPAASDAAFRQVDALREGTAIAG